MDRDIALLVLHPQTTPTGERHSLLKIARYLLVRPEHRRAAS
jgi:hypothetical protein